jgi:hypothetical protein
MTYSNGTLKIVQEARRELQHLSIPWNEVEQAVTDVLKDNHLAQGAALRQLIVDAAIKYWCTGMGCC